MNPITEIPVFELIKIVSSKEAIKSIKRYDQPIIKLAILLENFCKDEKLRTDHFDLFHRTFQFLSKKLIQGDTHPFLKNFKDLIPLFTKCVQANSTPKTDTYLLFCHYLNSIKVDTGENIEASAPERSVKEAVENFDPTQFREIENLLREVKLTEQQQSLKVLEQLNPTQLLKFFILARDLKFRISESEKSILVQELENPILEKFELILPGYNSLNLSGLGLDSESIEWILTKIPQYIKLSLQVPRRAAQSNSEEPPLKLRKELGGRGVDESDFPVRKVVRLLPENLYDLALDCSDLHGEELKSIIEKLPQLISLTLKRVKLSASDWSVLAHLKKLVKLHLIDCLGYEKVLDHVAGSNERLVDVSLKNSQNSLPWPKSIANRCTLNQCFLAIQNSNFFILERLLDLPNVTSFAGLKINSTSLLHVIACQSSISDDLGEKAALAYLMSGGDINAFDLNGDTALTLALKNGNAAFAATLFNHGANPYISVSFGMTSILETLSLTALKLQILAKKQRSYQNFISNPLTPQRLTVQTNAAPNIDEICRTSREFLKIILEERLKQSEPLSKQFLKQLLEDAIEIGDYKIFRLIYDYGINIKCPLKLNRLTRWGASYLFVARENAALNKRYKEIADFIEKKGGTLDPTFKNSAVRKRKALANFHGIKGNFKHNDSTRSLEYSSQLYIYWYFADALDALCNHPKLWNIFDCIPLKYRETFVKDLKIFSQAIRKSINKQSPDEIMHELRQENPVIINTLITVPEQSGYYHSIPILLLPPFCLQINCGYRHEITGKLRSLLMPTEEKTILNFITALQMTNTLLNIHEYSQIIENFAKLGENLNEVPEFQKNLSYFNKIINLSEQKVGNCQYTGLEGAFLCFLLACLIEYGVVVDKELFEKLSIATENYFSDYSISTFTENEKCKEELLKTSDLNQRKTLLEHYLMADLQTPYNFSTPTSSVFLGT